MTSTQAKKYRPPPTRPNESGSGSTMAMLNPAEYGSSFTAPSAPATLSSPAIRPSAISGHSSSRQIVAAVLRSEQAEPVAEQGQPDGQQHDADERGTGAVVE